ncbi:MAG: membrane protein insertion efficiency factor YidD [Leptospira sp.]|nr:membrane protein insertion efficiency factor YidD [Leptospira sp.]
MNRVVLLLIYFYKKLISPMLPPACRFSPTCSEYAAEAFRSYPFFSAFKLSAQRISRCHPFHEGGLDPLPKPNTKS